MLSISDHLMAPFYGNTFKVLPNLFSMLLLASSECILQPHFHALIGRFGSLFQGLLPIYVVQLDVEVPDRSMSLIRVSMGVFPTRRTKNTCSITLWFTVRIEGSLNKSLPRRLGCVGYWPRT